MGLSVTCGPRQPLYFVSVDLPMLHINTNCISIVHKTLLLPRTSFIPSWLLCVFIVMEITSLYIVYPSTQDYNYCFMQLSSKLDRQGKKQLQTRDILSFICTYVAAFSSTLFLHMDFSYPLVFIPFSQKDFL